MDHGTQTMRDGDDERIGELFSDCGLNLEMQIGVSANTGEKSSQQE